MFPNRWTTSFHSSGFLCTILFVYIPRYQQTEWLSKFLRWNVVVFRLSCDFSFHISVAMNRSSKLVAWIFEMRRNDFNHSRFSGCYLHLYCYIHNVSPRYVLRPSLGVCQTREPTQNFKPRPLFNPRGSLALIPLAITRYKF